MDLFLRRLIRGLGAAGGYFLIALLIAWPTLALNFDFPFHRFHVAAVALYLLIVGSVVYFGKTLQRRLLGCLLCCALTACWWFTLQPSNDGKWQADVSKVASIAVSGDHVVIHNFRQCDYRTEFDYACTWSTQDVDLAEIRGVDVFLDYWGSPWIAHTILSFDAGDRRHIAFSIEARKQTGQSYSALRSFFRQFTLISIVSDERDLVRLRTNYRVGEDLYLYRTRATPEFARSLFMNYVNLTNQLSHQPRWYNAITHNCTTEIFTFKAMRTQKYDWRILLNGKADEMEYEQGDLVGDLPFAQLKARSHINAAARAANQDPQFSTKIREGNPGFTNPSF